jgi:acyl-CoA synthetase (AMP-forming)/AMP-acid ligase II/1-acyl-sn-glycerol-3-phosphate acyltransferase/acyl carrier protein
VDTPDGKDDVMAAGMNRIFWMLVRLVLPLRYRVECEGFASLRDLDGPVLVLPNHPAYVDPPIVLAHVGLRQPLRPLVFSGTYRVPFLLPLMRLVRAFEVPDLSAQSRDAAARTKALIEAVVERVQAGESFLIYPSGRLQRGNREVIGSARFVHELVSRCPELTVVLIRTRGVWGSLFSCARAGTPPPLARVVLQAAGWLLAALVVFLPRRRVRLHAEVIPRARLPLESREAFNAFLEDWFNENPATGNEGETPTFVRYSHLFGPAQGDFHPAEAVTVDPATLNPKTIPLVNDLVASFLKRDLDPDEAVAATPLEDLGLDSLDRMELALRIEQQFGFRSSTVAGTLGELWALADGKHPAAEVDAVKVAVPERWHAKPRRRGGRSAATERGPAAEPAAPDWLLAPTIAEAFVKRALERPHQLTTADAVSGGLTYRRLLVGAGLMARRFAAFDEPHVGVMLPASVAADLAFFGLHLAGKIPVMLNWTTGPANLAHALRDTETRRVVTSRKLVDRLGIEVAGAEYVFLEDVKGTIGKSEALGALASAAMAPSRWLDRLPPQAVDEPAVFLFTSGSESAPKTVPLSHRNLCTNILDSLDVLRPSADDSLLGFLPPFHSFGLTGNVLLPQLTGIRCVRHADPTDAAGLVRIIEAYRPSLVFTTPTFLGYILARCSGGELASLRKIITGAEACPDRTYDLCRERAPEALILEGYGITECSPVVAANRLTKTKRGSIGLPVRHVDVALVHEETQQPVAAGETGMLLVRGPSVFDGYRAYEGPSPFVEHAGERWYRTGDLVSVDDDGYLRFRGRLKRFLKAAGEMISLPALEEPFQKRFPPDERGPRVAVEGVETDDGRHIVLFTTFDLALREAAEILLADGLRGVMRLDEVRRLDAIPVLGTGKTDYTALRALCQPTD